MANEFKGTATTILISVVLFVLVSVMGLILQNPALIQQIIGIDLWIKLGAFILVVGVALLDVWTPRLKAMVLGTEVMALDRGAIYTFFVGTGAIIATVIVTNPTILEPIMGLNGAPYIPIVVGLAAIALKVLAPRNQEQILVAVEKATNAPSAAAEQPEEETTDEDEDTA